MIFLSTFMGYSHDNLHMDKIISPASPIYRFDLYFFFIVIPSMMLRTIMHGTHLHKDKIILPSLSMNGFDLNVCFTDFMIRFTD